MSTQPENIISLFKAVIEDGLIDSRIQIKKEGYLREADQTCIWMRIKRDSFHKAVSFLKDIAPPHISCPMASRELDEGLELIYPFTLFSGEGELKEIPVIMSVVLPKDDLTIRTVTDIIPGILYMERETQEMLGVVIEDIPDGRRLFTPDNLRDRNPLRSEKAPAVTTAAAAEKGE